MGPRIGIPLALAALLAAQGSGAAQGSDERPPIAPSIVQSLESAAHQLAKGGKRGETNEVADLLAALGQPRNANEKLRAALAQELAKAPAAPPKGAAAEAARSLRSVVPPLTKILKSGDRAAEWLAPILLRIDGNANEARAALGYEKIDGLWLTKDDAALRARRSEIQVALRRARTLPVALEVTESKHPALAAAGVASGVCVRYQHLSFHAAWSAEKTTRVVREGLRATALSRWLMTGELKLPEVGAGIYVTVDHKANYLAALEDAKKAKALDDRTAEAAAGWSAFYDNRGYMVDYSQTEGELESATLAYLTHYESEQAPLEAGHLNWVSLSYLGAPLPGWIWKESKEGEGAGGGTSADLSEAARKEREEMFRLSKGGIAGSRSWMAYLAERREDPPFSRAMVDQMGKIVGDDLLKCTFVVEYLQERAPLDAIFRATRPKGEADRAEKALEIFAKAFGEPIPNFEERWRRWLLRDRPSLLERLDAEDPKALSPVEEDLLRQLNALRARAFAATYLKDTPEVRLDRKLSDGARLHSLYLGSNPAQAAAWPDAHEEYPDKEGFTAEGAWAGLHSVIAPGCATAGDALDGWMGTFYHRLPLLEPGLIRVGWGLEKKFAVLDSGSIAAPPERPFEVAWPPDGAADIPTHFRPELPNPIPDGDQSRYGYPVTLQVGLAEAAKPPVEALLRLHQGNEKGPEVECWFSSPQQPTNPDCAPARAFCLIPKNPLAPKTRYTVVATWAAGGKPLQWSFTTR